MCKLAYIRTKDKSAYKRCVKMIKFQENIVAGQSTGFTFRGSNGFHTRKSIGKTNSFLVKYPDTPSSNEVLGHSRWASVGTINLDNQQPISIMFKNKKIGYAIHNGTFSNYRDYEHYRSSGMKNKTDSALLISIYSRVLKQLSDSKVNRRRALAFIKGLIKNNKNHNLIFMFKDGQVLFTGNALTYKKNKERVGIMTFGLSNKVNDRYIYEIKNFKINKFLVKIPSNIDIERKKSKFKEKYYFDYKFKNGVLQR